jgi:hypothetical protein
MWKKISVKQLIQLISILGIVFSFSLVTLLYLRNRSLWLDEAMLAYSFMQRNLFNLVLDIFERNQSAPIIYLYIVKVITLVFGASEFTLRVVSLISFMGLLLTSYGVLKSVIKVKYPLLGVAFISTISILIRYSNEFKPYMLDAFLWMLIIWLYFKLRESSYKFLFYGIVFPVIIWLSYPIIFIVASILMYDFMNAIIQKRLKHIFIIGIVGVLTLISFYIQYVIWLEPVATSSFMIEFWENYEFPLIPTNLNDVIQIIRISSTLFNYTSFNSIFTSLLVLIGMIILGLSKNKLSHILLISIILFLIASYLGFYPIYPRLMLFIYPIFGLLIFNVFDFVMTQYKLNPFQLILFFLIIFSTNYDSAKYLFPQFQVVEQNEVESIFNYMDQTLSNDSKVFINYSGIPVFMFENNYNFQTFETSKGYEIPLILESSFLETIENLELYDDLIYENDLYLLIVQYRTTRVDELFKILDETGHLTLLMDNYGTYLFHYSYEAAKSKTSLKVDLLESFTIDNVLTIELKILNQGDSIINHEVTEPWYFIIEGYPHIRLDFKTVLLPNSETFITYKILWPDDVNKLSIQLVQNSTSLYQQENNRFIILERSE